MPETNCSTYSTLTVASPRTRCNTLLVPHAATFPASFVGETNSPPCPKLALQLKKRPKTNRLHPQPNTCWPPSPHASSDSANPPRSRRQPTVTTPPYFTNSAATSLHHRRPRPRERCKQPLRGGTIVSLRIIRILDSIGLLHTSRGHSGLDTVPLLRRSVRPRPTRQLLTVKSARNYTKA